MARTNLASGFAGFLIGVVTGCAICAAAAVFITNSPIPFVEKVQKVTADVDPAQKLAGGIDPNRALNEQQEKSAEQDDSSGVKTVTVAPPASVSDARRRSWRQLLAAGRCFQGREERP